MQCVKCGQRLSWEVVEQEVDELIHEAEYMIGIRAVIRFTCSGGCGWRHTMHSGYILSETDLYRYIKKDEGLGLVAD